MGTLIRDGVKIGGTTVYVDSELSLSSTNAIENQTVTNSINQITPLTLEYNNTSTYAVNDYCIYNNTLYRCITDISTTEDFTPAHWISISITSDLTEINNTIGDINTVLEEVL